MPEQLPALYLAALRPGMLHLAGKEADGAILNWLSADDVAHRGGRGRRRAAGGGAAEIVARIFVIPTEDADLARTIGRRMITAYLNVHAYAEFHRWLGRGPALQPMWDAWAAGDRKAALAAIPDEVVDELVVHGSPAECRAHVQRYVDNGVTIPALAVIPLGVDLADAVAGLSPSSPPGGTGLPHHRPRRPGPLGPVPPDQRPGADPGRARPHRHPRPHLQRLRRRRWRAGTGGGRRTRRGHRHRRRSRTAGRHPAGGQGQPGRHRLPHDQRLAAAGRRAAGHGRHPFVARLRAAGCVVVGKTNTPEFAWSANTTNAVFGPTRNPFNPEHGPGGSSGGAAAALAAGMVPLATGSDGGGSIRIPSACCGLSGMKPSRSAASRPAAPPRRAGSTSRPAAPWPAASPTSRAPSMWSSAPTRPTCAPCPRPEASWLAALDDPHVPVQVAWAPTLGYATVDAEVPGGLRAGGRRARVAGRPRRRRRHRLRRPTRSATSSR